VIRAAIALAGVALVGFYLRELWLWQQIQAAPVTASMGAPNPVFAVLAVVLTLVGLGLTALGLLKRRAASWAGFRVLPMLLVLVLSIDFIVLSSVKSPVGTEARAKGALQVMTEGAQALATMAAVPDSNTELDPLLPLLGPVPWLVHGERPEGWLLEIHRDCPGPRDQVGQTPVGTVLYCVAPDRRRAWLTVVGLALEQERGEPGVVSLAPDWVGEVTLAREDAEPDDPEPDVDVEPTPDDAE